MADDQVYRLVEELRVHTRLLEERQKGYETLLRRVVQLLQRTETVLQSVEGGSGEDLGDAMAAFTQQLDSLNAQPLQPIRPQSVEPMVRVPPPVGADNAARPEPQHAPPPPQAPPAQPPPGPPLPAAVVPVHPPEQQIGAEPESVAQAAAWGVQHTQRLAPPGQPPAMIPGSGVPPPSAVLQYRHVPAPVAPPPPAPVVPPPSAPVPQPGRVVSTPAPPAAPPAMVLHPPPAAVAPPAAPPAPAVEPEPPAPPTEPPGPPLEPQG